MANYQYISIGRSFMKHSFGASSRHQIQVGARYGQVCISVQRQVRIEQFEYEQVFQQSSLPSPSRHQIQVGAIGRIESRCRFLVSGRSDSGRSNISRSLQYINQIQVAAIGRIERWCRFLVSGRSDSGRSNISRSLLYINQVQVGAKGRIYIWYVCIFLKMQFRQVASSHLSRSTIGLLQANYQYIFRQVFY